MKPHRLIISLAIYILIVVAVTMVEVHLFGHKSARECQIEIYAIGYIAVFSLSCGGLMKWVTSSP